MKRCVEEDKFQWLQKTTLPDFHAMIHCGNHAPLLDQDQWEKWTIKSLSNKALSLILDYTTNEVMNSCFQELLKTYGSQ